MERLGGEWRGNAGEWGGMEWGEENQSRPGIRPLQSLLLEDTEGQQRFKDQILNAVKLSESAFQPSKDGVLVGKRGLDLQVSDYRLNGDGSSPDSLCSKGKTYLKRAKLVKTASFCHTVENVPSQILHLCGRHETRMASRSAWMV